MSGLLALLDDVAAIAKVAAASVDDVVGQAAKAGAKAAGAVIDDAAVTPRYLHGFDASREIPIVWRIAKGSLKNKLLYLLPAGLLLTSFAPWAIMPLLMVGGAYLCYEGAEKVAHAFHPASHHKASVKSPIEDPAHLEEEKARGAIKTDFILSAEIMTIALAAIPRSTIWMEAATLAAVGIGITVIVYGGVALIVKADDVGLHMAERGRLQLTRIIGRAVVKAMPGFLQILTTVGTAAMLWVGGSIVIHGMEVLGLDQPAHAIHDMAEAAGHALPRLRAVLEWLVAATSSGILGLGLGLALLPAVALFIQPAWSWLRRRNMA